MPHITIGITAVYQLISVYQATANQADADHRCRDTADEQISQGGCSITMPYLTMVHQSVYSTVQLIGIRLTQATGVGTLDTGKVRVGCAALRDDQQYTAAVSVAVSASP